MEARDQEKVLWRLHLFYRISRNRSSTTWPPSSSLASPGLPVTSEQGLLSWLCMTLLTTCWRSGFLGISSSLETLVQVLLSLYPFSVGWWWWGSCGGGWMFLGSRSWGHRASVVTGAYIGTYTGE